LYVSKILQFIEKTGLNDNLFMSSEWNVGILAIKAEVKHYNYKKLLQTHYSIIPLFHYSIIPLFHYSTIWGEAPKFYLPFVI